MKRTVYAVIVVSALALSAFAQQEARTAGSHSARAVLSSRVVDAVEYDLESHRLVVQFKSGRVYEYLDVPDDIFSGLINAEKPGRFYVRHIRGKYESRFAGCPRPEALATVNPTSSAN